MTLKMNNAFSKKEIVLIIEQLINKNEIVNGTLKMHVSRIEGGKYCPKSLAMYLLISTSEGDIFVLNISNRPKGIEFRPHVVEPRPGFFVMWFENRPSPIKSSGYSIATSNSPLGPFITEKINVDVNYTPNGVRTFEDGSPTQIQMGLTFRETEILTKEKINQGY